MSELEYEPQSPLSVFLRIAGSALAAVAVVAIVVGASVLLRKTTTAVSRIPVGSSPQLAFRSSNADLRIVPGSGKDVVVRARVTNGLRATTYALGREKDNATFSIVGRCIQWLSPGCGVSATIEVPDGYPLLVATGSGNVELEGLKDRVVTVATGSGSVTGRRLAVQELSVNTDHGIVTANFADQPYALKVTTDESDIRATIPRGKIAYLTNIKSTSGHVSSTIRSDRRGDGLIRLLSTSGNIVISQR